MSEFKKINNQKYRDRIKTYKYLTCVGLAVYVLIMFIGILSFFDNKNAIPLLFLDHYDSLINSETIVSLTTLLHRYSNNIPGIISFKYVLFFYTLLLCGSYLLAFYSAIGFLNTLDNKEFKFTIKSAKHLENLSTALIINCLTLFFTQAV